MRERPCRRRTCPTRAKGAEGNEECWLPQGSPWTCSPPASSAPATLRRLAPAPTSPSTAHRKTAQGGEPMRTEYRLDHRAADRISAEPMTTTDRAIALTTAESWEYWHLLK